VKTRDAAVKKIKAAPQRPTSIGTTGATGIHPHIQFDLHEQSQERGGGEEGQGGQDQSNKVPPARGQKH